MILSLGVTAMAREELPDDDADVGREDAGKKFGADYKAFMFFIHVHFRRDVHLGTILKCSEPSTAC